MVGASVENEYFNLSNGNSEQHTNKGLMVWRKIDNWTAYTNGYMTWINGPYGVQSRLNTDRFDWEKDTVVSAPAPAPIAAPRVSAEEAAYLQDVLPNVQAAGNALTKMGDLLSQAGKTPALMLDKDWRAQMAVTLAQLKLTGGA